MKSSINKLKKERKTVQIMIKMHCRNFHESNKHLCEDCDVLLKYVNNRLDFCSYSEKKPACSNCSIHCYKEDMRERIKEVMRYSGPKMIFKHPILAFSHLYKSKIKNPYQSYSRTIHFTWDKNAIIYR